MTPDRPARRRDERTRVRRRRVCALIVLMAVAGALGDQVAATSSPTAPSPSRIAVGAPPAVGGEHRAPAREGRGAHGAADGVLPDGTTVVDDEHPGVARLDPALLDALRDAAADGADAGVTFVVDSGWRSAAYQQHLLDEAVREHGSRERAARWVAAPDRSAHVSGDAVDVGPSAAAWLSARGAEYGLCQVYANEPWHYELRPRAGVQGCPAPYADPSQDPRLRP